MPPSPLLPGALQVDSDPSLLTLVLEAADPSLPSRVFPQVSRTVSPKAPQLCVNPVALELVGSSPVGRGRPPAKAKRSAVSMRDLMSRWKSDHTCPTSKRQEYLRSTVLCRLLHCLYLLWSMVMINISFAFNFPLFTLLPIKLFNYG